MMFFGWVCTIVFFCLFLVSFYRWLFFGEPLYIKLVNKASEKDEGVELSVIYEMHIEYDVGIVQIDALYDLCMEKYGCESKFEIIIILDEFQVVRPIKKPRTVTIRSNHDGIVPFITGCAYSSGEFVIDSKFIAQEIGNLDSRRSVFFDFIEPKMVHSDRYSDIQNHLIPVAASREAFETILSKLPVTCSWSYMYLQLLVSKFGTEKRVLNTRYSPVIDSIWSLVVSRVMKFFIKALKIV